MTRLENKGMTRRNIGDIATVITIGLAPLVPWSIGELSARTCVAMCILQLAGAVRTLYAVPPKSRN